MISLITAGAFVLAWFGFRYERHRRWRSELDAAYATLQAVHDGMTKGLMHAQGDGWGDIYFSTVYTEAVAKQRAKQTRDLVLQRGLDTVLAVPTEPLARGCPARRGISAAVHC